MKKKEAESMARPAKPVNVIQMEKKSHRTKKELAVRQKSEQEMLSGERIDKFTEVKNNTKASREFDRVVKILDSIEKNDKMYETVRMPGTGRFKENNLRKYQAYDKTF